MFHEYQAHDIAVYGGYLENDNELLECTSGGIATAISKYMLSLGGLVAGVSYSKDFYAAQYEIIDRESQLDRFKGSKYVEVQKGKIYRDVKDLLDRGKSVLFFGLPCSVAALNTFLGGEYDGLITCELVCQGPTSPKVHVEYIQYLEKNSAAKSLIFP